MIARARRSSMALMAVVALVALRPAEPARRGGPVLHREQPLILRVDEAPADAAALLQRVARILDVDLGLPLPARIVARVYDGPVSFEQGLITHAAVPAAHAGELARFAIGATIPGAILLVEPGGTTGAAAEWPRLIAHELTHLAQIELAATDKGPAEWLAEGMAEWVAYRVLDRLGLDDFEMRRALARAAAAEYVGQARSLNLDEMATPRGFWVQHQRRGTLLTYRLVLHLADELVIGHGFESLVGYFSAFRYSYDPSRNFAVSFGASPSAFARATVARLLPPAPHDGSGEGTQAPHAVNLSPKRPRVASGAGAGRSEHTVFGRSFKRLGMAHVLRSIAGSAGTAATASHLLAGGSTPS